MKANKSIQSTGEYSDLAPEQGRAIKWWWLVHPKSVGSDGALGVLVWCSVALARYNLVVSSPWIAARTARRGGASFQMAPGLQVGRLALTAVCWWSSDLRHEAKKDHPTKLAPKSYCARLSLAYCSLFSGQKKSKLRQRSHCGFKTYKIVCKRCGTSLERPYRSV